MKTKMIVLLSDIEVKNIESLCDVIQDDYQRGLDEISNCTELKTLEQDKQKEELARSSHSAKLWLLCVSYVGIPKQCIRAERTGNWSLSWQNDQSVCSNWTYSLCQIWEIVSTRDATIEDRLSKGLQQFH